MSDDAILPLADAYHPVEMVGVMVVNTAHEGYRRAGLVLRQGENTLPPLSLSVLTVLESDPRLVVTIIAADNDGESQGRVDIPGASAAIDNGLPPQSAPLTDVIAEPLPVVEPLQNGSTEPLPVVEPLPEAGQPLTEPAQKGRGKK